MANTRVGEGFIAVSPEARKKFWLDRSRTAAIAKHTNAFKINEDVVIPLPRMGEYTDGIERINIELSIKNKLQLLAELDSFFARATCRWARATTPRDDIPAAEMLEDRVQQAESLLAQPTHAGLSAGQPGQAAGDARRTGRTGPGCCRCSSSA
jgi:FAD/FMN-containing dehydrogenase